MDRKLINPAIVQDIADAIREKGGQTEPIAVNALGDAIRALPQGMGDNTTEVVEAISGEQPSGDIEIANAIAKGATDAAREHTWQGSRATDEGRELRDGVAFVDAIKGQSNKMVQIIKRVNRALRYDNPIVGLHTDGTAFINITEQSASTIYVPLTDANLMPYSVVEHVYFLRMIGGTSTKEIAFYNDSGGLMVGRFASAVGTAEYAVQRATASKKFYLRVGTLENVAAEYNLPIECLDLTEMYGAGNEPSTAEEFARRRGYASVEAMPLFLPDEPTIVNSKPTEVVSRGRNLWDERLTWGYYNIDTGELAGNSSNQYISSRNKIKVLPTTEINVTAPCADWTNMLIYEYDVNERYLGRKTCQIVGGKGKFTTSPNAMYMNFSTTSASYGGDTYRNDICINVSDDMNGTYTPYVQPSRLPLPLSSILHEGQPLFPTGELCGLGNTTDEVSFARGEAAKRYGKVDMGSLAWTYSSESGHERFSLRNSLSGLVNNPANVKTNILVPNFTTLTANQLYMHVEENAISSHSAIIWVYAPQYGSNVQAFVAAMQGVPLIYELSTPIEVTFDPAKAFYKVQNGGTEEAVMDGVSAPLVADIAYRDNMAYSEEAALLAFANERSGQNDADLGDAIRTLSE